jgi:glycosyltransferase involved in cell wall biosynthesis
MSTSETPKVSFVVPCYKLGHLLAECVHSILSQSYEDFEILIMDDCSPDNTPEVAKSFRDPRIRHVRNEPNLGHLRNYNKGIGLAKGEYVWLISADDSLRSVRVLERFVYLLESCPNVGYVFCPTMKVADGRELGVMKYSEVAARDTVLSGHKFLTQHLLNANIVPAPAAMARKRCYEQISLFPLDLRHAGDWYLWAAFALYSDVGFFAEPMVNRRFHPANMSTGFYREATAEMFANNIGVLQQIRARAEKEGFREVVEGCRDGIVEEFVRQLTPPKTNDVVLVYLTPEEFEESLRSLHYAQEEESEIRSRVFAGLADIHYDRGDLSKAAACYRRALEHGSPALSLRAKNALLKMGSVGNLVRDSISRLKQQARRIQRR